MKLLSICVQHLMKVASNKEKNEETRKEVEMALLALSCIGKFDKVPKELYLNEIKEIIKYHQEHRNLTQLAYQSAWVFLMERFGNDKNLDGAVADELCFARDAARELEELKECIDWKRKEEEEKEKEVKEVLIIGRWFDVIRKYLFYGKLYNESITGLIGSIIQVFRAAKDNHRKISDWCISFLKEATISRSVRTVDLLESEVVIVFLAEILQATTQKHKILDYLIFLEFICRRLKGKKMDEVEEVKRKELKRKIFDQLEEEGYEDHIVGLLLIFAKKMLGYDDLIKDDETYFVHL
ncbi:uncharacterized protein MONOS_12131 [Monocercomonoides exilis]|uniref:uncharacterized protein n=1 Tax=Monocercomonoides exilis TaxID=2049356 RepID=UPI00355A0749|nr:hypothetical protein MONOS_12131 [Monocercomonoides exilis]|eukprot:MONOS_12131.1-p1 / transcript=MONOS_12131.1 / gene=MONOS_12131 / organism=Monocercomonoides_exilis_PA203 / gene_product=unspecified product / transcript_product=unspecified product / location=Mono_scaffold00649:32111-33059(-) / protein_length=296 / sequence_SO=supercontig / SO=protein_coding / is_pseudo=false